MTIESEDVAYRGTIETPELEFRVEIFREGYLDWFLSNLYLPEYFAQNPDHYREIPPLLNNVLSGSLAEEYVKRALLVSGLPKCMAAGVPREFWMYSKQAREDYGRLREWYDGVAGTDGADGRLTEDVEFVLEDIAYTINGPADMDVKTEAQEDILAQLQEEGVDDFGFVLTRSLGIPDEDVEERYMGEYRGRSVYRHVYTIPKGEMSDNFAIQISFGPIFNNPDRRNRQILFIDSDEEDMENISWQDVAFKVHWGDLPSEANDARNDDRLGLTGRKQDEVIARLEVRKGRLYAILDQGALQVMQEADSIPDLDGRDIVNFGERILRNLRINLLWPPEDEVDFNRFFPLFKSTSVFHVQDMVEQFYLNGETIPHHHIIERELRLACKIDLLMTLKFLIDSDFWQLIPGMRHMAEAKGMTDAHLRALFYTDALTPALGPERVSPYNKDAPDYRAVQRAILKERYPLDGDERLIQSLVEIGMLPRSDKPASLRFHDLFDQSVLGERKVEFLGPEVRGTRGTSILTFPRMADGRTFNVTIDSDVPRPVRRKEAVTYLQTMLEILQGIESEPEAWKRALGEIREWGEGKTFQLQGGECHFDQVFKEDVCQAIFSILRLFPSGKTPRQVKRLLPDVRKVPFSEGLFLLKASGWLDRYSQKRIDERGVEVPVDFYRLRSPQERGDDTGLRELADNEDFIEYFQEVSGTAEYPAKYAGAFSVAGVDTFEALSAFTNDDFELMGGYIEKIGYVADLVLRAKQLCDAYRRWKQAETGG